MRYIILLAFLLLAVDAMAGHQRNTDNKIINGTSEVNINGTNGTAAIVAAGNTIFTVAPGGTVTVLESTDSNGGLIQLNNDGGATAGAYLYKNSSDDLYLRNLTSGGATVLQTVAGSAYVNNGTTHGKIANGCTFVENVCGVQTGCTATCPASTFATGGGCAGSTSSNSIYYWRLHVASYQCAQWTAVDSLISAVRCCYE